MTVLQIIGIVFGGLFVVILTYLGIVIFSPFIREPKQPLPDVGGTLNPTKPPEGVRHDVRFGEKGEERVGWLYLPRNSNGPFPCVVMNNGFGGTKEVILESYALRYVEAGIAVLTYDYRHFGESEGVPRHHYAIDVQIDDCRAAVTFARNHSAIDKERIAIWGTSSAGGYGVVVAATDPGIGCLVAQCPALDHQADGREAFAREGLGWMLRLIVHAQRDKGRSRFGFPPHHFPIVGKPGATALLTAPDAVEGYTRIAGSAFSNKVCARIMLTPHGATPEQVIEKVTCPALIQICDKDTLASASGAARQAERMGELAQIERYPVGHFDIYHGEYFEKVVETQIEFLKKNLNVSKTQ